MLKVYFTVDVEIWCGGWEDIDSKFNGAFQRYIYGPTNKGNYGLPYKLKVLNEHGLKGTFFVEPLFSLRFGSSPLCETVGLIKDADQSIELHLHTEWADEARTPPLPHIKEKRQHLKYFSLEEQEVLIKTGRALLENAGVEHIHAFRAGSFGFNKDTLFALRNVGIGVDSSYNATRMGLESGVMPGHILTGPLVYNGIYEAPMTVYYDRPGNLRHAQLCACSFKELEYILWKSLEEGRKEVVILSHNFELLDASNKKPNRVVAKRFHKLCKFLDMNRDSFSVEDFSNYACEEDQKQYPPINSPISNTGLRILEQAWSRLA